MEASPLYAKTDSTLIDLIRKRARQLKQNKRNLLSYLRGFIIGAGSSEDSLPNHGISLDYPHGFNAITGEKILMLSPGRLEHENENMYLLENGRILGVIRFGLPQRISRDETEDLELEHLMLGSERNAKWPKAKKFWSYKIFPVALFGEPVWVSFLTTKANHLDIVKNLSQSLGLI